MVEIEVKITPDELRTMIDGTKLAEVYDEFLEIAENYGVEDYAKQEISKAILKRLQEEEGEKSV